MISRKQAFKCKVCGRTFTEIIPDSIDAKSMEIILYPLCKLHRFKNNKSEKDRFRKDTSNA